MSSNNRTKIWLGLMTLAGVLAGATLGNWDKFGRAMTTSGIPNVVSQSGQGNVQVVGSNAFENLAPTRRACRDKSHGVERYDRAFNVRRTSHWMGGGYSQLPWCTDVVASLRGEHPDSDFSIQSHSETKKTSCFPLNCPQYQYTCEVQVRTDPVYVEKTSAACSAG